MGLLGYNNYRFFMYSSFKPFVEISIEDILCIRERLSVVWFGARVMGGEGKQLDSAAHFGEEAGWMLLL